MTVASSAPQTGKGAGRGHIEPGLKKSKYARLWCFFFFCANVSKCLRVNKGITSNYSHSNDEIMYSMREKSQCEY